MAVVSMERPVPGLAWSWRQLGGLCGILFVALFVIGVIVTGDTPMINDAEDDPAAVRQWFVDNGDQYLVGDFLIGIAVVVFYVPFLGAFRGVLREAEQGEAVWSLTMLLGAVFFALIGAAAASSLGALAVGAEEIDNDEVVQALLYADFYAFGGLTIVLVPFFLGASMVIVQTGVLWKWLGWLGLVLIIPSVIGGISPIDGDPEGVLSILSAIGFIGFGVFILIAGIGMIMRKAPPATMV